MIYDKKKHYVTCIGSCCPLKNDCTLYLGLGKVIGSTCINPQYKTTRKETICILFKKK